MFQVQVGGLKQFNPFRFLHSNKVVANNFAYATVSFKMKISDDKVAFFYS